MLRLVTIFILLNLIFDSGRSLAQNKAEDTFPLKIEIEGSYPPFSYVKPDNTFGGFEVDLAKAVCEIIHAECSFHQVAFDSLIPSILTNRYDVAFASVSITDERLKKVDFSRMYYNVPSQFVRKKGYSVDLSPDGLKGKPVGVQKGTIQEQYIEGYYHAQTKRYTTYEEALLDLRLGRIQLYFGDAISIDQEFLQKSKDGLLEPIGRPVNDPKWFGRGIAAVVRRGRGELLAKINSALNTIIKDGTYKRLQDKYFKVNLLQEVSKDVQ